MAAGDCPGRDALSRLVELREDRELFLDEECCAVIRGYIFRDLVSLPGTSLRAKIILAAVLGASLAAAAYGVAMLAAFPLGAGLVGLLIAFGAYRGHCRELAACRLFTCEERLAIIDEIVAAGHVSAEEAIALRANVEKLAREAPELATPWNRAAEAHEAAELEAKLGQIAASRVSRCSEALERFGDYARGPLVVLIPAAMVTVVLGELAGFPKLATILFLMVWIYFSVSMFGVFGVRMILQAYLTFRARLARGDKASAWSGLALRSLPGMISVCLVAVGCWACAQGILK